MNLVKPKQVPEGATILDVLSDSSYELEHIHSAKNYSIYELAFSEKIEKDFPDKKTPLYIYGYSNKTGESERADYVLGSMGYGEIYVIDGGLTAWEEAGLPVVKGKPAEISDGVYSVLNDESTIEWTGRNIGNKHVGSIRIKDGSFLIEDGAPLNGKIIVDMSSINNFDQEGEWKEMLVNHLKSSDFFDVEKHPTAEIALVEANRIEGPASRPNYHIEADLTIKGITERIGFEAQIHEKEGMIVLNAHLDVDRSKHNVTYGSEKFFARLGIHLIDDMISFDVILFLKR